MENQLIVNVLGNKVNKESDPGLTFPLGFPLYPPPPSKGRTATDQPSYSAGAAIGVRSLSREKVYYARLILEMV